RGEGARRAELLGTVAVVHLLRGELDLGRQAADRTAEELARSPRTGHFAVLGMSMAAETYVTLWEREPADAGLSAAKARRVCRTLARFCRASPPTEARALLWQGGVEWLGGRRGAPHGRRPRRPAPAHPLAPPPPAAPAH